MRLHLKVLKKTRDGEKGSEKEEGEKGARVSGKGLKRMMRCGKDTECTNMWKENDTEKGASTRISINLKPSPLRGEQT